jgi:hypothetical protein
MLMAALFAVNEAYVVRFTFVTTLRRRALGTAHRYHPAIASTEGLRAAVVNLSTAQRISLRIP